MREDRRKLAAIMAADVAGYSRLMGRDEAATVAALNACRAVFRAHIATHDGRVVDTAGDSVLAVFDSVVEAVQCGLDIQNELADLDPDQPDDSRMRFRIGVNLGDVIVQGDGTIYGDGVNIAARLEALAEPGTVCISEDAFRQVDGKLGARFDDIGEHAVKNIAKPIRVYSVRAGRRDEVRSGGAKAMHQEIRFCVTDDGAQIAYAIAGQGPPLLKAGTGSITSNMIGKVRSGAIFCVASPRTTNSFVMTAGETGCPIGMSRKSVSRPM